MKRLVLTTVSFVLALALTAATALGQSTRHGSLTSARTVRESGKPVLDWNQDLISIVNTPGAQPANIQPTWRLAVSARSTTRSIRSTARTIPTGSACGRPAAPPRPRRQTPPRMLSSPPSIPRNWERSMPNTRSSSARCPMRRRSRRVCKSVRWSPVACSRSAQAMARTSPRRRSFPGPIRATTARRHRIWQRGSSATGEASRRSCSTAATSSGPRPAALTSPEYASGDQ